MKFNEFGEPIKAEKTTSSALSFNEYGEPIKAEGPVATKLKFNEYGEPIGSGADDYSEYEEPKKPTVPFLHDVGEVPLVGQIYGALDGLGTMALGFGVGGTTGAVAGVAEAVKQGDAGAFAPAFSGVMEEVMMHPAMQPKTDTGLWIQEKIGEAFEWYTEKSKSALSGVEESLHANNDKTSQIAWTLLETGREALPFMLPYAPKAVKYGIEQAKTARAASEARIAAKQAAVDKSMKVLDRAMNIKQIREKRLDPSQPLDYKQTQAPDVRVSPTQEAGFIGPPQNTFSFKEFAELYKAENKTASTIETVKAWEDYNSSLVRSTYTTLKDTSIFSQEGQRAMQERRPGGVDPDVFLEQSNKRNPPGIEDVGVKEYTPLTMTRAEFEGAYAARINAGLGKIVRQRKDIQTSIDSLKRQQIEAVSTAAAKDIGRTITKLERQSESLVKKIERVQQKLEAPPTKQKITAAYNRYLKNRIPWEQKISYGPWKDQQSRAFDLREGEAAALKVFQEESAWRTMEEQSGNSRGTLLAMRLTEAFDAQKAKAMEKQGIEIPAQRNRDFISKSPASGLDDIIADTRKTLAELQKSTTDKSVDKITTTSKYEPSRMVDYNHKTRVSIQDEFSGLYSDKMKFDTFYGKIKERYPAMNDVIAKSIYNKLANAKTETSATKVLEKDKSVGKLKQEIANTKFSTETRGMFASIAEAVSGKAIGMLFGKMEHSKSVREIVKRIFRIEKNQLKPGEVNDIISYTTGQKLAMGHFSRKLQDVYDTLQLNMGYKVAVGPRNILPGPLGGFGGRYITPKINEMLYMATNGEPLPNTPNAVLVAAKSLRTLMDEMYNYMKESGLDVQYLENYTARLWKFKEISKDSSAFEQMLAKNGFDEKSIEIITESLSGEGGMLALPLANIRGEAKYARLAKNAELHRKLHGLKAKDVAPFVETNMHKIMGSYLDQVTKRSEWAKKFGVQEGALMQLILDAQKELKEKGMSLTQQEVNRIFDIADALQGTYKMIKQPWAHGLIKWPISVSNFALLQFATIASLPEVLLPVYHGGIKAYSKALPTAMWTMAKDMLRENVYKGISKTDLQQFAEAINKAGELASAERVLGLYSGSWSALDSFTFKANLLHSWTKFVNYVAIETYRNQVKNTLGRWSSNKTSKFDPMMESLMDYYGMTKTEALEWYRGGMQADHPFFEKFKNGAVTFAEDAILTSNPAIRPMWHSNPHLAILAHLKGFPVMMGNTIMKRWYLDTVNNLGDRVSDTRNMAYVIGTGATMITVSVFSTLLQDYLKYGPEGHPKYDTDDKVRLIFRATERIGFAGAGSAIMDAFTYGGWAGYVQAMIGAPAIKVMNDGLELLHGVASWDSARTARAVDDYVNSLIVNLPRMGIGVEQDDKEELRTYLKGLLEDYLGMSDKSKSR